MSNSTDPRHCPANWIVGLDLRPSGTGAIAFARWLDDASDDIAMEGLHVLEERHLQAALRYHHLDELVETATTAADTILGSVGAETCLAKRSLVQAVHASRALELAAEGLGAAGIIVGRQAPRDGGRIVRLGRTARRLLRTLPVPVVVVPPDYVAPAADSPVVVLTNMREDAAVAMHFGVELARQVGRPVTALHVHTALDNYASHYIPAESRAKIMADHEREAKLKLKQWLTGLGLSVDHEEVVAGHVTDTAVDYAKAHDVALMVSGSRRLSTVERMLLTSIGTELAGNATCPVAIVPPHDAGQKPTAK